MDFVGFNAGYRKFFGAAEGPDLMARPTVQAATLAASQFLVVIEPMLRNSPRRNKSTGRSGE